MDDGWLEPTMIDDGWLYAIAFMVEKSFSLWLRE
jgi:hypothetical protein